MDAFLKANPGLSSRFDKILRFDDYSPEELNEIGVNLIEQLGMKITPKALEHLKGYFKYLHDYRDKYFGNGRSIRQVIEEVIKKQNLRLAKSSTGSRHQANLITFDDVQDFNTASNLLMYQRQTIGFKK